MLYASTTHCSSFVGADSSAAIEGSATLVIVMSIPVVNAQRHRITSAIRRRPVSPVTGASAWCTCNRAAASCIRSRYGAAGGRPRMPRRGAPG